MFDRWGPVRPRDSPGGLFDLTPSTAQSELYFLLSGGFDMLHWVRVGWRTSAWMVGCWGASSLLLVVDGHTEVARCVLCGEESYCMVLYKVHRWYNVYYGCEGPDGVGGC